MVNDRWFLVAMAREISTRPPRLAVTQEQVDPERPILKSAHGISNSGLSELRSEFKGEG